MGLGIEVGVLFKREPYDYYRRMLAWIAYELSSRGLGEYAEAEPAEKMPYVGYDFNVSYAAARVSFKSGCAICFC